MSVAILYWEAGISLSDLHSLTEQVGRERGFEVDEWTQTYKREPIGDSLLTIEIPKYVNIRWRLVKPDYKPIEFIWSSTWRKDRLVSRLEAVGDTDIAAYGEGDYGEIPDDILQNIRATKLKNQLSFYHYFKSLFNASGAQLCCAFDSNGWDMKDFDPEASRLQLLRDWHCVLAPSGWNKLIKHLENRQLAPRGTYSNFEIFLFLNEETGQTCDTIAELERLISG